MWRRSGAALAVLALFCGLSAAPYTHAHSAIDDTSDGHPPHASTLVHTHAAPHSHHDSHHSEPEPAGERDSTDQIWSVNSFVSQQAVPSYTPAPIVLAAGAADVSPPRIVIGRHRPQPKAHGPPVGSPSGLRAPPAVLPLLF